MNAPEPNNLKSQALLHQVTFNGPCQFFGALCQTVRHNPDNHVHTFEAICVIVQYQMDNGSKLYDT
jgi:predicted metal-dependent HD superfamily phosphohydrolase